MLTAPAVNGGSTLGTITVANGGSAAGDVDCVELVAIGTANYVNEGDLITFVSDGNPNTACITRCTAIIKKGN